MILLLATLALAADIHMTADVIAPLNLDEVVPADATAIWLDTDRLSNQWQARNHGADIYERHPDCWTVRVGEAARPCDPPALEAIS